MVDVPQDMMGLEAATAQLDQMEADALASSGQAAQQQPPDSANTEADRAAQPEATETKPDSISTDTPATTDTQQKPDATKEPSRYAKAQQRQENAWQTINREKEAIRAEREQFERTRQEFDQARKAQEDQYSQEQYEKAAKQFEQEGKFDMAEAARTRAEELRKNPPPTPEQAAVLRKQADDHQKAMKEWWGKAAVDYPAVAKDGSPESTALKAFLTAEPDAVNSPKGMYYAARLVSAETVAASVPKMEKELGALRAKVKELEALTAPGGPSISVNPNQANNQSSDEQQLAELEALAQSIGPLR